MVSGNDARIVELAACGGHDLDPEISLALLASIDRSIDAVLDVASSIKGGQLSLWQTQMGLPRARWQRT